MRALVLFAGIGQGLYCLLLFLTALFLILLILIQRGRGGGLSGAFGGMGGQSAFGAKAGDTFTKITIIAATVWIVLCLIGVKFLGSGSSVLVNGSSPMSGPVDNLDLSLDLEGNAEAANADGAGAEAANADGASAEGGDAGTTAGDALEDRPSMSAATTSDSTGPSSTDTDAASAPDASSEAASETPAGDNN